MNRKTLLLAVAVAAIMPLANCASQTTTSGRPLDMGFTQMAPLQLNVGAIKVIDNTEPSPNPRVSPAGALTRYANRRLQAMGGEGVLNFVIQQASLTTAESEGTGTWTDAFQISQPLEYTVTMRVGLDLAERVARPNVRSAFTLERKKTLPADTSLADRDAELNKLVVAMVQDMDQAVQRGLNENMKIVVAPGAITFGTPAPMDSQGTLVVPPSPQAPATARPVIIQGTMN